MTHLEGENGRLREALEEILACLNQRNGAYYFSTVAQARLAADAALRYAAPPASGEAEDRAQDAMKAQVYPDLWSGSHLGQPTPPPPPTQGEEERVRELVRQIVWGELSITAALRQRADEATEAMRAKCEAIAWDTYHDGRYAHDAIARNTAWEIAAAIRARAALAAEPASGEGAQMSEEEQRIRKAAGRTGGYSRSVLADDLRVVIAELDALRLRTAGGEASQGEGDDSYMTPAQLRDHIQDLLRQRCAEVTEALEEENFALAANQCDDGYGDEWGNHRCRAIDRAVSECEFLAKRATELVEVLKPFANFYERHFKLTWQDHESHWTNFDGLTVGDLRRARDALAAAIRARIAPLKERALWAADQQNS